MDLIIDTREQNALPFKVGSRNTIEVKTLKVGDYSLKNYENEIAIERKSPSDLFSSLGKGHSRFKKELGKSQKLKYFAIVVEGDYDTILHKDFESAHFSKMKGYVITSILFTLHMKYGINVFFCKDRYQSVRVIKELFKAFLKLQEDKTKTA